LTKDAKVPLASAIGAVKELQSQKLDSISAIAKGSPEQLIKVFNDQKVSKSVLSAAKKATKKRSNDDQTPVTPNKREKKDPFALADAVPVEEVERSLELHSAKLTVEELSNLEFVTNRAPLVLAFAVMLLKYTMPEQPPSSRWSLAQAVVSLGSQSKARMIGLSNETTAEEQGWGQGQPTIKVMGREISVLKRWGYAWPAKETGTQHERIKVDAQQDETEKVALWALDLEKLKKIDGPITFSNVNSSNTSNLPVYDSKAAQAYLYRSFDSVVPQKSEDDSAQKKKPSAKDAAAKRSANVGALLQALDMLFESWSETLTVDELDKRAWSWYVQIRPEVENGISGWGQKGSIKLKDILDLRRKSPNSLG